MLDIGVNEGLWTIALAEKARGNGKVVAFEPVNETFRVLISQTRAYKNIRLLNIGLCADKGTAQILRDPISDAPPAAAITNTENT